MRSADSRTQELAILNMGSFCTENKALVVFNWRAIIIPYFKVNQNYSAFLFFFFNIRSWVFLLSISSYVNFVFRVKPSPLQVQMQQ